MSGVGEYIFYIYSPFNLIYIRFSNVQQAIELEGALLLAFYFNDQLKYPSPGFLLAELS
jgi:hypothetical protein